MGFFCVALPCESFGWNTRSLQCMRTRWTCCLVPPEFCHQHRHSYTAGSLWCVWLGNVLDAVEWGSQCHGIPTVGHVRNGLSCCWEPGGWGVFLTIPWVAWEDAQWVVEILVVWAGQLPAWVFLLLAIGCVRNRLTDLYLEKVDWAVSWV
jgi:hypothetical protein